MGQHHINITDKVYEKLERLKEPYKAKSFTQLLDKLAIQGRRRGQFAAEISEAFTELKTKIAGTVQDGCYIPLIEELRNIVIHMTYIDDLKKAAQLRHDAEDVLLELRKSVLDEAGTRDLDTLDRKEKEWRF